MVPARGREARCLGPCPQQALLRKRPRHGGGKEEEKVSLTPTRRVEFTLRRRPYTATDVLSLGATLVTHNARHFRRFPDLPVEN